MKPPGRGRGPNTAAANWLCQLVVSLGAVCTELSSCWGRRAGGQAHRVAVCLCPALRPPHHLLCSQHAQQDACRKKKAQNPFVASCGGQTWAAGAVPACCRPCSRGHCCLGAVEGHSNGSMFRDPGCSVGLWCWTRCLWPCITTCKLVWVLLVVVFCFFFSFNFYFDLFCCCLKWSRSEVGWGERPDGIFCIAQRVWGKGALHKASRARWCYTCNPGLLQPYKALRKAWASLSCEWGT